MHPKKPSARFYQIELKFGKPFIPSSQGIPKSTFHTQIYVRPQDHTTTTTPRIMRRGRQALSCRSHTTLRHPKWSIQHPHPNFPSTSALKKKERISQVVIQPGWFSLTTPLLVLDIMALPARFPWDQLSEMQLRRSTMDTLRGKDNFINRAGV